MWSELARTAGRQAGVVAVSQAVAAGVPRATFFRRAARDGWRRVSSGVYLLPAHRLTPHARLWSAVLAAGGVPPAAPPQAAPTTRPRFVAATGLAAAWLHGIRDQAPAVLEVVIAHDQRAPTCPGVRFVRSRSLRDEDLGVVRGLPCVSVPRIGIDLAPTTPTRDLRALLIDARQRRHELGPVAGRALESTPFPGRGRYLRVLRELADDAVDSEFARLVASWLRGLGFEVVAEHPIRTGDRVVHADLALVPLRIAVECDGFGAHSSRSQLAVDARRSNGLALRSDWIVLRITWDRWEGDRDGFLAELRAAVDLRTPR